MVEKFLLASTRDEDELQDRLESQRPKSCRYCRPWRKSNHLKLPTRCVAHRQQLSPPFAVTWLPTTSQFSPLLVLGVLWYHRGPTAYRKQNYSTIMSH